MAANVCSGVDMSESPHQYTGIKELSSPQGQTGPLSYHPDLNVTQSALESLISGTTHKTEAPEILCTASL